jgi:hypothetical protein
VDSVVLAQSDRWSWDVESFLRAEAAGIFGNQQVELVRGEVRRVIHGIWHGVVAENVSGALINAYRGTMWRTTSETLLLPSDAPDPDCWVRRRGLRPLGVHGRVERYDPADALLVVEVADTSEREDLSVMAELYGTGGVAHYWVVTRRGVFVHAGPMAGGYLHRDLHGPGSTITPPGTAANVSVDELLDVD